MKSQNNDDANSKQPDQLKPEKQTSLATSSQIYNQEVNLPILQEQQHFANQNSNSFINSSIPNTGNNTNNITPNIGNTNEDEASGVGDSAISINGIELKDQMPSTDELTDQIMDHLNFDQLMDDNIDEII